MSTDLALPPAMATCPVSYSPQCDNIVRRCRSGAEVVKGKLVMINMPTRYERSQISARLGMVANALAGCAPKAIKADVRGMLGHPASRSGFGPLLYSSCQDATCG